MILLFTAGGRIGNQLFQIAYAVSRRRKGEWVLAFGFGTAFSLLFGPWKRRFVSLDGPGVRIFADGLLYPLLYHGFVRTGLMSAHYDDGGVVVLRQGRVPRWTLIKGYFESAGELTADLSAIFRLKESLRSRVKPLLREAPAGSQPIFIHIRRTDLLDSTPGGKHARPPLPGAYYERAIQLVHKQCPDSFLFILGDDPDFAERLFRDLPRKWISRLSAAEDLALMSLCRGGVLSNSTFAWWGAFFGKGERGYIAPLYWNGWSTGRWRPPGIRANFMTDFVDPR